MSATERPLLVLVSGAPASGKSTLATRLAADFGIPILAKDEIKEALFETLGAPDRERSAQLSLASFRVLFTILARLVEAGVAVVVDCNFHRGRSEAELLPIVARSRAVLIHCQAAPTEIIKRYEQRVSLAQRHAGHHDTTYRNEIASVLASGTYDPIDLDLPTIRVDTTDGYDPDIDAIWAFIKRFDSRDTAQV
jgi:predicted kinase